MANKRSITIDGRRTSITIEEPFWQALKDIAAERGVSTAQLVEEINTARRGARINLSSAIRTSVFTSQRVQQCPAQ